MTTKITGIVRDLEGQPLANSMLRFERRSGVRAQDGATVVPRVVNAKTDAGGNISVELYPGEYRAQAERGAGALTFSVGVPEDVAEVDLQDLLDQVPAITPMWASETRQARDEAVDAAESVAGDVEAAEAAATSASDSAGAAQDAQGEAESARDDSQKARDSAAESAAQIAGLSAEVTVVLPDDEATASYDAETNVLSFELPRGPEGPEGPGLAEGGSAGDILKKDGSADFDTRWESPPKIVESVSDESFTGDGTTKDFALSVEPEKVDAFVAGIYQSVNAYTLSGSTVSFSEPPPNGVAIALTPHVERVL